MTDKLVTAQGDETEPNVPDNYYVILDPELRGPDNPYIANPRDVELYERIKAIMIEIEDLKERVSEIEKR